MVGAMVMQTLWINNEWKSKREDFDRDVQEALYNVALRLETQEAASFLTSRFNPGMVSPRIGNRTVNVDTGMRSKSAITISGYSQTSSYRYTLFDTIEKQSESFFVSGNFLQAATHDGHAENGEDEHLSATMNDTRVGAKSQQLHSVLNQLVMEWNLVNVPIEQRVDLYTMHELIKEELQRKGIQLPFQFGVMKGGQSNAIAVKSASFSDQMIPASFTTSLFPNDINFRSDRLMVFFDDVRPYIIRSMWLMIVISVILLLMFVGTFFTAIYVILKQKKLSEIKTDFINNMTHEFKTPIATISLAIDSINNPKVLDNKERIQYFSDIIARENKRMNKQVENILQMALLDKENFELNPQLLNVNDLIAAVSEPFQLQVSSRRGTIILDLNASNPYVLADEIHFTNVIHNLLDNANKYSRETPEIVVSTSNEKDHLLISVRDKGIGMNADTQKKIFEKFFREQNGNVHDVKGFGLGLAYVKSIVNKHGGSIRVTSEPGKGSEFTVTMPYGLKQKLNGLLAS